MKNSSKIILIAVLIIVVIATFFLLNNYKNTTPLGNVERVFKNVSMSIYGIPTLNQAVDIIAVAESSPLDIPNATFEILLPEGFEWVGGNLKWKGDIKKNDTILLKAEIKAIKTGDYAIQFLSTSMKNSLPLGIDTKFIYVSVSENSAKISDIPSPWVNYKIAGYDGNLKTVSEKIK